MPRDLGRCGVVARGIRVWLDEERLVPGRMVQPQLEQGIERSSTGAVLVGTDGLGPWESVEMQVLLSQAVSAGKPVISVLLPDAPGEPELPLFLRSFEWVDLRTGFTDEGIDKLIWGITDEMPDSLKLVDGSTPETTATPSQLWPDRRPASRGSGPADRFARLLEICSRGEVTEPEERRALWQDVKKDRPSSFLAWQLANVARWGAPEYLEVDERFTPLRVHVRVRESADAPAEKQEQPCDSLAEAMSTVFEDEAAQSGEIRFVHQQMQEYFAAWVLAEDFDPDKLAVPWRSVDLPESTEALLVDGGDDDLPELPTTGWEEAALMAASLSEAPEAFVRALIPANLALAGRCAAQPGLSIPERLRGELQTLLIDRTRNPPADLRIRIAAGKALGELGDPRLQEQRVRAGVKPLLPAFASIPGGEYRIGGDPEGYASEHPARNLTLAGFELAVHPVTNAEFARFLKAGGYRGDTYWLGRALAWRDGEIGQEGRQQ